MRYQHWAIIEIIANLFFFEWIEKFIVVIYSGMFVSKMCLLTKNRPPEKPFVVIHLRCWWQRHGWQLLKISKIQKYKIQQVAVIS